MCGGKNPPIWPYNTFSNFSKRDTNSLFKREPMENSPPLTIAEETVGEAPMKDSPAIVRDNIEGEPQRDLSEMWAEMLSKSTEEQRKEEPGKENVFKRGRGKRDLPKHDLRRHIENSNGRRNDYVSVFTLIMHLL